MPDSLARKDSLRESFICEDDDLPAAPSGKRILKYAVANVLESIWRLLPARWTPAIYRLCRRLTLHLPGEFGARLLEHLMSLRRSLEEDYPNWVQLYDQSDENARQMSSAHIANFADPPRISVIMPVFDPAPAHLRAAIDSVRTQFYPHWQLCIADDASTDPAVVALLREMEAADPRISVIYRTVNGHIAEASNSALSLATGEFVAFLDHDDLMSPPALYEVASRIVADRAVDILYSDEDHIDDTGRRSMPYFKPDWNPELMAGQNVFNHLTTYRRSLVRRIGGFRAGMEGSQDYDLALRAAAVTAPERIVHIPHVLYHWRQNSERRSYSERALDRCAENGRRAVAEYLSREFPGAQVEPAPLFPRWNRVIFPVPVPQPLVSVVIPTRNFGDLLARAVDGLLHGTNYQAMEVLIADNGSDEPETLEILNDLARDKRVRVLRCPGPFNFSALNNRMVEVANGSLVLLLNNDIEVADPDWMREMVSHAVRPRVGAVGAKLLYPDGTVQHGGVLIGMGGVAGHQYLRKPASHPGYFGQLHLTRTVSAVTGACLMVRRDLYLDIGGLDEISLKVAFNDIDFCLRLAERGYRNIWTPFAKLYHHESASRGSDRTPAKAARFEREVRYMQHRWGKALEEDPHWNPNLYMHSNEVNLAFPPRVPSRLVASL